MCWAQELEIQLQKKKKKRNTVAIELHGFPTIIKVMNEWEVEPLAVGDYIRTITHKDNHTT